MVEKIKGIKIKGRCFKAEENLICFPNAKDRISIVYGKNGSGKSTISEGFSAISKKETSIELVASLLDEQGKSISTDIPNIFVFNEKYIDENVKIDDDGLGTIILLGSQVNVQKEIDEVSAAIDILSKKQTNFESEIDKYEDTKSPLNPLYHKGRITNSLKRSGGWSEIDAKIKKHKRNSSVTDEVIDEIGGLSPQLPISELKDKFNHTQVLLEKVSDISITYPERIEQIKYDFNLENKLLKLLAKEIEKPVLTERETLIFNAIERGNQVFVESALDSFKQNDINICPYCYQVVSEEYKNELVRSIRKVLNKDVDEHKNELKQIYLPILMMDIAKYESLDSSLVKEITTEIQKYQKLIEKYQEYINKKLDNVFTPLEASALGLNEALVKINKLLVMLETKRSEFNNAVMRKKKLEEELVFLNKQIAHFEIAQTYRDYLKQEKDKKSLQKDLQECKKNLENKKEELTVLNQRKSNIGLAINSINNAMDYVFFSKGRLSIELRNDKYYLKSNGNDVRPKNVSLGERNIVALCYFFTQIMANQEVSKLYQNETFIIVDDPISSFDFENKVGIISFLRYQANRIIRGNQNSKILIMSHDLETVFGLRKAMEEICQSTKGIAGLTETSNVTLELDNSNFKLLINKHNEYKTLLHKMYHYANGDISNDTIVIGNVMRRALEAFSTFTYQKGIEQVSCDKNVINALGNHSVYFENLMYRLVLHGESHYEEQVYSIHNGNNFYEFISEDEKRKTAKNVLCFMYFLNEHHLIAYLQSEANAIKNIKEWAKDIPDNNSFEIQDILVKRIIHLYELSLSTGLGNESFEEIPYVEIETENSVCDFALKISGDSMEPKIKDGSIVLVKNNKNIEEGKVGAFYHNGKMLCKYLSYDGGKTLLCSYNEQYEPIEVKEDDDLITYGEVVEVCD